ncbi:hypothetical protein DPMN_183598 [Dreissena polymorpha]|uniref:J domain-containing protein n=1 Tax=Dreissena polymorpha TaxID=45954 RepID=A0A9D4DJ97_DREPO|nr:hypothetical protein DPMN_183598 [Dreissena polymorpha]
MNADALFVRGMCLYYQDNIDKAFSHFQQVLRLAPDHQKARETYRKAKQLIAKKEEGNKVFRAGNFEEAYKIYTEALEIDPNNKFTNSKLYCNRATVCTKIGKNEQSVEDCTKAIELDDTYLKAYMRRAKSYMDMEQYEEAVRDYEKILQLDKTRENKRLLQEAKLELKKSKRKDYYKILGVSKTATDDEIKKAYRKRALSHHPDRHSHDTVEFKEVGEAYSVLSDQKKRTRYDQGHDMEDLDGFGGGGFNNIDPNLIFQSFFGGGGGGHHFNFGGGGGGSGGFPGGFSFQCKQIICKQIIEGTKYQQEPRSPWCNGYDIIEDNLLTKFHEDRTIHVTSRVLTRQMWTPHDTQRTTDKRRSQKLTMSTLCSGELKYQENILIDLP